MATVKVFIKGFLENYSPFIISSVFGAIRGNKKHHGIDIACPSGTKILAPIDGQINKIQIQTNGYGLYVVLRHWVSIDRYFDIYFAHLSNFNTELHVGKEIKAGDYIGKTGGIKTDQPNAGHSTGAHLHLEIRKNQNPIDPLSFLYKEKCIEKNNKGKILNWGTYKEGFDYTLSDADFKTLTSVKIDKDNTDWGATESIESVKKKTITNLSKERLAPGIWQIVKLLVDSSVENKQVLDSGISTQQGSILNFFHKVCQEPLVEFMGDTFGDQYYFIVRKPPFDKEGITKMIDLTIIELNSNDIISTNLGWNNQGIYSWYQYMPHADLLGSKQANQFIPAVFFPEYASVWGSRPLTVESNYYNFFYSGRFNTDKAENKANNDKILKNTVVDFKYLIESNAYAPFTRKGTITLQGDRRIKRGTLIMHTSGEIFYVDNVTNSYEVSVGSVSRTTTLTVSRGMFPKFIYGWTNENGKTYSYFNIIDFGETEIESINSENWRKIMSKWKVNIDVFGFFMRKEQLLLDTIKLPITFNEDVTVTKYKNNIIYE